MFSNFDVRPIYTVQSSLPFPSLPFPSLNKLSPLFNRASSLHTFLSFYLQFVHSYIIHLKQPYIYLISISSPFPKIFQLLRLIFCPWGSFPHLVSFPYFNITPPYSLLSLSLFFLSSFPFQPSPLFTFLKTTFHNPGSHPCAISLYFFLYIHIFITFCFLCICFR